MGVVKREGAVSVTARDFSRFLPLGVIQYRGKDITRESRTLRVEYHVSFYSREALRCVSLNPNIYNLLH